MVQFSQILLPLHWLRREIRNRHEALQDSYLKIRQNFKFFRESVVRMHHSLYESLRLNAGLSYNEAWLIFLIGTSKERVWRYGR